MKCFVKVQRVALFALLAATPYVSTQAWAQEPQAEAPPQAVAPRPIVVPEVVIIGEDRESLDAIPGSASVVNQADLKAQAPLSTSDALRMVPGVFVQTEDPLGLRTNIGIRGLDPVRSRKVLILEDGMPITLAPYGEPESYYTPPVERMERLELVKGSGSILFGPQTIGGVINYITPRPPEKFTLNTEARGGMYGYGLGQVTVGDTKGMFGYWANVLHQRFAGPRALNVARTDVTGKFVVNFSSTHSLSLKLSVYDEVSNATYLGLTTAQFENDPNANYASNDLFTIRRYALSATHALMISDAALLETRVYAYQTLRYWRRQDHERVYDPAHTYERIIDGSGNDLVSANPDDLPNDGSLIYFLNSSGNRNREFLVGGIEPRVTYEYALGKVDNELQAGMRFHVEQARERYIEGPNKAALTGAITSDDLRAGYAFAAYAQNRIMFLNRTLKVSPGLRFENLWATRTTYRDSTYVDDVQVINDYFPPKPRKHVTTAIIPGIGVSYSGLNPVTLFGGVHRGFAPPRTKDSIANRGQLEELEAEYSWNYELGARTQIRDFFSAEATAFALRFDNQVIVPSEAGGATAAVVGSGLGAVNGGMTEHWGAESSVTLDVARVMSLPFGLPITLNYTFVRAYYLRDWNPLILGNTLPYAPEHQLATRVRLSLPFGLMLQADGTFVSSQFTDPFETVQAPPEGIVGQIPARFILDAQVRYTIDNLGLTLFVAGKNITNQRYISSRAPLGIQPGLPLHIFGGAQWAL